MKINTSVIQGFAEMSDSEKLKALLSLDVETIDKEKYIKKETFDNVASELSKIKKELKAKMSDEETAKMIADEERKSLEEKYNALVLENTISKYKTQLITTGYDEVLAQSTAEALANGEIETVLNNQRTFVLEQSKLLKADLLKGTPLPVKNGENKSITKMDLRKMSPKERLDFSIKNPEQYKTLYGGEEK